MLWRFSRFIPKRGFNPPKAVNISCTSKLIGEFHNTNSAPGAFCNSNSTQSSHSKEFFDKHNVWGLLSSIDIRNCNPEKIRDPKAIEQYVIELCLLIDMKRFGPCTVVNFGENEKVAGYSMVQLIETSCISGHFANATNTSYIDIFSCKYYNPEIASKFTADYFGSKDYVFNVLSRR